MKNEYFNSGVSVLSRKGLNDEKGNGYIEEFKADIMRFVRKERQPVSKVAKDYGVNSQTIRNWLKTEDVKGDEGSRCIAELEAQLK